VIKNAEAATAFKHVFEARFASGETLAYGVSGDKSTRATGDE
jgi:hypothetical protein